MNAIRHGLCVVCGVVAMACAQVDAGGEAVEVVVVEGEAAALRSTPALDSSYEGQHELNPGVVPGSEPFGGADRSVEEDERDCSFQERADIKCPPGLLLGTCVVHFEEWADGSIHIGATVASCSISAAPSNDAS